MAAKKNDDIQIVNTTTEDYDVISLLFKKAMELQGKNGYKVWNDIDEAALKEDIKNKLQYKILRGNEIVCIFSIQFSDPFIWRNRDKNDAIYLHRIVVNSNFKRQRQFEKVLNWAMQFAQQKNLKFVRMDTWADNENLINYYKSFGFELIENYKTTNAPELPMQNRNLNVALLEIKLSGK